jgi:hypothetical protein
MIKTETIIINDKNFTRTYSDSGFMIERDNVQYDEAIDPIGLEREYIETDVKSTSYDSENEYAEAGKILLGVSE